MKHPFRIVPILAGISGCHTSVPIPSLKDYLAAHQPAALVVQLLDHSVERVAHPRIANDSLIGVVHDVPSVTLLSHIRTAEAVVPSPEKTVELISGAVAAITLGVFAVVVSRTPEETCPHGTCSSGDTMGLARDP